MTSINTITPHQERNIPGLDTLRCIAIFLVIGRHAWEMLKWPSLKPFFGNFGWIGVDLFFVLSGFLIGSQLIDALHSKGKINFKSFYFKRALRILPAYYVVLALYVFWPEFREKPSLEPAWRFVFFVMNIGPKAEAFSHAWSLCIEEHFYLLFPIAVALLSKSTARFRVELLIGGLIVGGIALRSYLWSIGKSFYPDLYRPTYVHFDGLLIGVSVALLKQYRQGAWQKLLLKPWALLSAGLLVVASGLAIFGGARSQPDLIATALTYPMISLGFGSVLMAAMSPQFWLSRIKFFGVGLFANLAFSLYLTHKQMIHLAQTFSDDDVTVAVIAIGLIVLAALALYYMVERPFLFLRDRILRSSNL